MNNIFFKYVYVYIYTVFLFNKKLEMFILTDVYCYYNWCFLFRLYIVRVYLCIASVYLRIRECIFMHCKCIFTHSQVCIYVFASVYLRVRKCIFTPQVYLYTTGVNLRLFGVNIEAKQFTPKKCIFTLVVYIYTCECVNIHPFWCFYRGRNLHFFWCFHNTRRFRV